jgi:phosphoribosylformylglycinamidine (FGAM) synthase-like amidotransferase family enzyme
MRLGFYGGAGDGTGEGAAGEALRAGFASAGVVLVGIGRGGQPGCDALVVAGSGGGGDGDEHQTLVLAAIEAFARTGAPVLVIGAGVRVLCGLGQLPGQVTSAREGAGAAPAPSHVRVEGRPTPFTSAIPAGRVLRLGAGTAPALEWQLSDEATLAARGQVIFRACDAAGGTRVHARIAGVSNERGNVVGLLATAEIVAGEGEQLLRSLRLHLRAAR